MLKTLGIIAFFTAILMVAVAYYAGAFDPVRMSLEPCGPYNSIYREYRGSYRGFRFLMNDVYHYVHDSLGLSTDTGFSVFYDNPEDTPRDSLRSICGIITNTHKETKLPYKKNQISETNAVVGRYRLRSFLSYTMGSYKFYSGLERCMVKNGKKRSGPVLELYDMKNRVIVYIAPYATTGISPIPPFQGD